MRSAWLVEAGFPVGAYAVRPGSKNGVAWDAVQFRQGEETIYWRGDVSGAAIQGSVSRYLHQGGIEDYTFSGVQVDATPAEASSSADQPS